MKFLNKVFVRTKAFIGDRAEESGAQYTAFGIFGIFNFPLFYFTWLYFSPQTYENIYLRIIATVLCLFLALHKKWPSRLSKYLPLYWYCTLLFTLPFFFTFMLIMNHGSEMWLTNTIVIVFFVLLLVDWLIAITLLLIGSLLGIFVASFFTASFFPVTFNYVGFFITYFVSIIIGIIFAHNKQVIEKIKRRSIKAEANSRAKSEFIANISHDIRTPITGILGLAQSFKDTAQTESHKTDAGLLIETTGELLNLLNEVIELVSLENDQPKRADEIFSLAAIAKHNYALLQSSAKHKKLGFNLTISSNIPDWVYGNRTYLDRIILNLLSNAIKFTQTGDVSLTIDKMKSNLFTISVKDSGIGIPQDQHDSIFEHFTRLTPSYQGIYKGNGLGLYTVKKYLDTMEGEIELKSEVGEGSTFTVIVPLKISSPPENEVTTDLYQKVEPSPIIENDLSKFELENPLAHVLVVEDNALAARMIRQQLAKCNSSSEVVNSGEEAVKLAETEDFDLVIMDIGLPGIDGLEASRQILKTRKNSATPIVALTGHLSKDKRQQCLDAGMQEMFPKPLTELATQRIIQIYVFSDKPQEQQHDTIEKTPLTIDLGDGANLAGGDETEARTLLKMLAKTLPKDIDEITRYHSEKNYKMLHDIIHKMYGGLCYCGVPQLRKLTKTLNESLLAKQYTEIDRQVSDVVLEAKNVIQAVEKL